MSASATTRTAGFTLLEMLAVIALTALVLTAAADYYVDLSRASTEAVEKIRHTRRAARLLDRLAHELEGSVMVVKPAEMDPFDHPWLFLAEADDTGEGAQRVKFVTRSHRAPAKALREQDLAMVSYVAEDDDAGGLVLWRKASPHLPERLDTSFPRDEGDGAQILSEDLAAFGMRFLNDDGEWVARFDSSTLLESGQLPRAAEIELAFLEQDELGDWVEGARYRRRVVLPLRPLDIQAEIEAGEELLGTKKQDEDDATDGDGDGDGDGNVVTIEDCLEANPRARILISQIPPGRPERDILNNTDTPLTDELRDLARQFDIECP